MLDESSPGSFQVTQSTTSCAIVEGNTNGHPSKSTDGFDVQVGRSTNAQTVHIPQYVLSLCPDLSNRLVPGCRIVNADPVVFAIIIEHLQPISVFGMLSINGSGCLSKLISSEEPMLNFVKAWHILDMLRKPMVQDQLLKIYRTYYMKCLQDRLHCRLPLEPNPLISEPFIYLRNNVGNHSKAEKFLIDFHAGQLRDRKELKPSDFESSPPDIEVLIRDRWLELCGRVKKDSYQSDFDHDRIAAGDTCYKIKQNEAIEHGTFQVQYVYEGSGGAFGLNPPLPISPHAEPRENPQTTLWSASVGTKSTPGVSAEPAKFSPQPRLENPFEGSTPQRKRRDNSTSISPSCVPTDHGTQPVSRHSSLSAHSSRHPTPRKSGVSFASDLPSQAPFMASSPSRRSWSHDIDDVAATDGESVYDLFAPNLRWNGPPPNGSGELGAFSVLDFAA